MSKTKKSETRPLTVNEKKAIIISVICVVMVAILVVSLVLVLKPAESTPDDSTTSTGSSTLYIKNGDFKYFDTEATTFPKSADNWTRYTYKAPEEGSEVHGVQTLDDDTTAKIVSGVINTSDDEWENVVADLTELGITGLVNPGVPDEEAVDQNVYMFATKEATRVSIFSQSFSLASQTSAKITVRLNTSLLKDNNQKVTVTIQEYLGTSSLGTKESTKYAYDYEITKADGWQEYTFYVFNRQTSSQSTVCTIGIGNVFTNETAEGILFVDDVEYETVSANDYRLYVQDADAFGSNYGLIGEDKSDAEVVYQTLNVFDEATNSATAATAISLNDYLAEAVVDGKSYSPFTVNDHFVIYKISNDGQVRDTVAMVLKTWTDNGVEKDIIVESSDDKNDHMHIKFWVRVNQNNVTAQGNIILQSFTNGSWENLDSGSFTSVVTSQDIADDSNCGWSKYDIYMKPTTAAPTQVRILFALGSQNGYTSTSQYIPQGTLYVTSPVVEQVSYDDYTNASSGSYSKKLSLVGDTANTTISNGSFSSITTNNPIQPTNWYPVFAGYNYIYKDGAGNEEIAGLVTSQSAANGVVVKNNGESANGVVAPYFDDSEQNILKLTNSVATAYGYVSSDISLSAHTVYSFSVLAKTVGTNVNPYFYVVKNNADSRADAILGQINGSENTTADSADDNALGMLTNTVDAGNGWTRYYIVVVTGDSAETVRVALFNGSIDGSTLQAGTVYYDYVAMDTIGSYTIDTSEHDEEIDNRDRITFTAATGYTALEELSDEELTTLDALKNVEVSTLPDWNTMVEDALESANATTEDTTTEDTTTSTVDWGLLLSVVSSIALVAALLIVVVIRLFKRRNNG